MSLNERFGRNSSGVRTVNIPDKPDVQMLQKLLGELSMATMGTQCDVSWQSGDDTYTLSLNHSRQTTRANWKLSRGKGTQSITVWTYATNDVSIVHKAVSNLLNKNVTQSQIRMPSASDPDVVSQERRAVNINGNLSGKLRKLFIGTQEDLMAGTNSALLPGGRTPARSIVEYVD